MPRKSFVSDSTITEVLLLMDITEETKWIYPSMAVIPCRLDSNRLPNKPLLEAGGKALLHWTHDRAVESGIERVIIATPDRAVEEYCERNDLECYRTYMNHPTGTHRCAEVVNMLRKKSEEYKGLQIIFNWQVDEPLVSVVYIKKMREYLEKCHITITTGPGRRPRIPEIVTLTGPLPPEDSPNVVKTVRFQFSGICPWFTRAMIGGAVGHCGVYGFRDGVLKGMSSPPTDLSKAESLEQLIWIEAGYDVRSVEMEELPLSINTPEDWVDFSLLIGSNA
jgi:3-deoxy-manno-octulosonate cytidylyltransferase (CMP-KDO synthetase)